MNTDWGGASRSQQPEISITDHLFTVTHGFKPTARTRIFHTAFPPKRCTTSYCSDLYSLDTPYIQKGYSSWNRPPTLPMHSLTNNKQPHLPLSLDFCPPLSISGLEQVWSFKLHRNHSIYSGRGWGWWYLVQFLQHPPFYSLPVFQLHEPCTQNSMQ